MCRSYYYAKYTYSNGTRSSSVKARIHKNYKAINTHKTNTFLNKLRDKNKLA